MKKSFKYLLLSAMAAVFVGAYFSFTYVHAVRPEDIPKIVAYAKTLPADWETCQKMRAIIDQFDLDEDDADISTVKMCLVESLLTDEQADSLRNDRWENPIDGSMCEPISSGPACDQLWSLICWVQRNIKRDPADDNSIKIYSALTGESFDTVKSIFQRKENAKISERIKIIMDDVREIKRTTNPIDLDMKLEIEWLTSKFSLCMVYPDIAKACFIADLLADEQQMNSLFDAILNKNYDDLKGGFAFPYRLFGICKPSALEYWVNKNIAPDPANDTSIEIYSILTGRCDITTKSMFGMKKNIKPIMAYTKNFLETQTPTELVQTISNKFRTNGWCCPAVVRACLIASLLDDERQVDSLFNSKWKWQSGKTERNSIATGSINSYAMESAVKYWVNENIPHDPENIQSLYIYSILTEKPLPELKAQFREEKMQKFQNTY